MKNLIKQACLHRALTVVCPGHLNAVIFKVKSMSPKKRVVFEGKI